MFEEAVRYIETHLSDNWVLTPIDFDNAPFESNAGEAFLRCQVEWASTEQIGVGGRYRGEGIVLISVFSPANSGSRNANEMADDIAAMFNLYQYNGLKCRFASTMRIGQYREWYQINVIVPFQYDDCLA
jgi:hypothetical protein